MVPPRIELGFCPRQGHVLTIRLWDLQYFKKYNNLNLSEKIFLHQNSSENFVCIQTKKNPFFIWNFLGLKNLLKDFSGNPTNKLRVFLISEK